MKIHELLGGGPVHDPLKAQKEKRVERDRSESKDQVDLSPEARSLFEAERERRFDRIRQNIESGHYLRREIVEHVADALLTSLKNSAS